MLNQILNLIKKILPKKLLKKILPIYHFLLAKLSALIYNYPSEKMLIIGVTGTAGKSSTCYFIAQILESAGYRVGMTTTTLFKIGHRQWLNDKKMTMLGRFQTQKLLARMVREKCQVAIIETSSQGIEQFRHIGINYDILVFTNLYPEHIEAHGGFENYKNAKGKLFYYLSKCHNKRFAQIHDEEIEKLEINKLKECEYLNKTIIVNGDDENAEYFLNFKADKKMAYGVNNELRIKNCGKNTEKIIAENIQKENGGYQINIKNIQNNLPITCLAGRQADYQLQITILGDYNLYNILAGVSVAEALDIPEEKIKTIVANLKPLPGRLEFIENDRGINILVDYAFEPEALKKLYQTIKDVPHNRIIHVLGAAGGGRDTQKRPKIGLLAAQGSDVVIVTNEDPYDEEPLAIIKDVAQGVADYLIKTFGDEEDAKNFKFLILNFKTILNFSILNSPKKLFAVLDRREAIALALKSAEPNDLILITGKGAEQAICVKGGKMIPWDDRKVIKEELEKISQ